jgi:hypothetical protein
MKHKSNQEGMAMELPSIGNYGKYSSDNYGAHTLRVSVGNLTVYFSYRTPVAFRGNGWPLTVSENDWGTTTGKHLNWIDGGDKKARLPREKFQHALMMAQGGNTP